MPVEEFLHFVVLGQETNFLFSLRQQTTRGTPSPEGTLGISGACKKAGHAYVGSCLLNSSFLTKPKEV